ncbi:MAG TPA: cation diffusion facilitator family transporter [Pseudomonadales bacterium]
MQKHLDAKSRNVLLVLATRASVVTALVLITAKAAAWFYSGSASLLGSLVDSLMDSMASVVNLLAVRYALQPPDEEHRFGHGKAEPLAGVIQAAFILGSAVFLLLYCVERLVMNPMLPVQHTDIGIAVMVFSIVATLLLVIFQRYVVSRTQSSAIRADALHYRGDILMNGSVLLALIFSARGMPWLDSVLGIAIAFYIAWGAVHIGYDALQSLLDRELPDDVKQTIVELAHANPKVRGIHNLRTRQSGGVYIIQMHLEMDDDTPLIKAHAIADNVENRIRKAFPQSDVMIHQDPHSIAHLEHPEEFGH